MINPQPLPFNLQLQNNFFHHNYGQESTSSSTSIPPTSSTIHNIFNQPRQSAFQLVQQQQQQLSQQLQHQRDHQSNDITSLNMIAGNLLNIQNINLNSLLSSMPSSTGSSMTSTSNHTVTALQNLLRDQKNNLILPQLLAQQHQQQGQLCSSIPSTSTSMPSLNPSLFQNINGINLDSSSSPSSSLRSKKLNQSNNQFIGTMPNDLSLTGQFDQNSKEFQQNFFTLKNQSILPPTLNKQTYHIDDDLDGIDGTVPDGDMSNSNKANKMLIVSAHSLTKIYGTKLYQQVSTTTQQIEGNIRKSNLKCVVCQDKAVSFSKD